ncbi:hypothetical protein D9M69_518970 [compost metagenome]
MQAEVVDPRRHVFQLTVVNDVLGRTGAVDKHHVDIAVGVVEPARHGHDRRDTDAAAEVKHLWRGEVHGIEQPDRSVHRQLLAFVQGVVQPVGDLATRYALDGHRKAVRHRWRAGNGVRTHDRLAFNLQLQGDKLPRFEEEHDRLIGHEAEGAHIPGFLDDFDATDDVPTIGPGLGGYRIQETIGHADLHGRLPAFMLAILRIAQITHLPICDIDMLIATSPQRLGLARREQIAPCRPWIRFWPAPAPHSPHTKTHSLHLA